MSMIGILICLSWDWTVWTFFRRIWSLSDTTFGRFGVVPHCLSCFACVASDCVWFAFFSFSYLCLLLWLSCAHMFFPRKLFSWIESHAPASAWTWDVQSITTVHSFYLFICILDMWPFCAHMVFSRKLLSLTDTRPVDDKYNVEKSRCALLETSDVHSYKLYTLFVSMSAHLDISTLYLSSVDDKCSVENQGVHFWKRNGFRVCKNEHLKF